MVISIHTKQKQTDKLLYVVFLKVYIILLRIRNFDFIIFDLCILVKQFPPQNKFVRPSILWDFTLEMLYIRPFECSV